MMQRWSQFQQHLVGGSGRWQWSAGLPTIPCGERGLHLNTIPTTQTSQASAKRSADSVRLSRSREMPTPVHGSKRASPRARRQPSGLSIRTTCTRCPVSEQDKLTDGDIWVASAFMRHRRRPKCALRTLATFSPRPTRCSPSCHCCQATMASMLSLSHKSASSAHRSSTTSKTDRSQATQAILRP